MLRRQCSQEVRTRKLITLGARDAVDTLMGLYQDRMIMSTNSAIVWSCRNATA
jgi:hypothetical protein